MALQPKFASEAGVSYSADRYLYRVAQLPAGNEPGSYVLFSVGMFVLQGIENDLPGTRDQQINFTGKRHEPVRTGDRMAKICGNAFVRKADERLLSSFSHAKIERSERQRDRSMRAVVLLRNRWIDEIDNVLERDLDIGIFDVVRAGGAHAKAVPVLDDADAREFVRHDKCSDAGLCLVGVCPDKKMGQPVCSGDEALATGDQPARSSTSSDRRWQAAPGGRAKFRLDARRIQQQRMMLGLGKQASIEVLGPMAFCRLTKMVKDGHRADERDRRITPAERRKDRRDLV